MATEAPSSAMNGESSQNPVEPSPAALLQQKHAHDEAHRMKVEETIDEDDVRHDADMHLPPPSGILEEASTLSEKAAEKQPENVKPSPRAETLDTQSETQFPALGDRKPAAGKARPTTTTWSARPPTKAPANGLSNGFQSAPPLSSTSSTRASTPASGVYTPSSTNASATPQYQMPKMSIPGKGGDITERIVFTPSQVLNDKQLKKPIGEILKEINKRSKANVVKVSDPNGRQYIFQGRGPQDAVRQALKEVAQNVGSRQSVRVPVPATTRTHIIGRNGSTIQEIQKKTGARIQFPKADSLPADDEDNTIDVTIEGDAVSAEMARREIEAIVNERTSSVNLRLREIPPELFPFIAGRGNSRIQELQRNGNIEVQIPAYDTWTHQPPPQAEAPNTPPKFVPDPRLHIQIAGERAAAQAARAQIEALAAQLRQEIVLRQIAIDRRRHQFIVGERGASLHDFFAETGCGIILPPDHDDTEFLTISGPPDKIDYGINRAVDLASSMHKENVDLCRLHPTGPNGSMAHAQDLTQYMLQQKAIADLERQHSVHIATPTSPDGPMTWDVFSKEGKNGIHARSDITNLILAHPPTRLRRVNIDPFFHEHIHREVAPQIRNELGVHTMIPDADEGHLVLVFEAPQPRADYQLPRQRPSQTEVAEFEKALRQAQEQVLALISEEEKITSTTADVPKKYHDKLRRFVARERQAAAREEIPLLVTFGEPSTPRQAQNATPSTENVVQIRGPESRVQNFVSKVKDFVAEQQQDEFERGFTLAFDFPQKYANQLIGTKGANIRALRDEFDVEISVKDGKITIQGPQAKAERAKSHIVGMGKKFEDEVRHVIKIPVQYHGDLIGQQGANVNRLQERYKTRIQFPRSPKGPSVGDDQSIADTTSEVGGTRNGRPSQAVDEVVIRGPKQGADKARDELLDLLGYLRDRSHTTSITVPQGLLPSVIGQGGREIQKLRDQFDVSIDVPKADGGSGKTEIKLKGTKQGVDEAKKALAEKAKIFDETITHSLEVDKKYHRALIGQGGSNIRKIVIDAGGPDDRAQISRIVRFPNQQSDENVVRVEGTKAVAEKIVASIKEYVEQKENSTSDILDVAPEKHRRLIGRDGDVRKGIESKFNVTLDIPRKDSGKTAVRIAGLRPDVDNAKEHILSLVGDPEGETIQIPKYVHHQMADNGAFFRRLRQDHRVNVDHAGQQPPPKPKQESRSRPNGANMPLITDDDGADGNFSWDIVHNDPPTGERETIPWNLSGEAQNIAKARAVVEAALEKALKPSSTGYLILPDPKTYRFVVGPNGSHINAMRKKTECQIQVPNERGKSEAIEITGPKEGVEQAKDLILEAVKNGQGNGSKV